MVTLNKLIIKDKSFFPLLIRYEENNDKQEVTIINEPQEIENGRSFKVLTTHYEKETKE